VGSLEGRKRRNICAMWTGHELAGKRIIWRSKTGRGTRRRARKEKRIAQRVGRKKQRGTKICANKVSKTLIADGIRYLKTTPLVNGPKEEAHPKKRKSYAKTGLGEIGFSA